MLFQILLFRSTAEASQLEELAVRAGFRILAQGNSSPETQKRAESSFPLKSMTAENRERAKAVVEKCTQFRRLPELQYAADPAIYKYLLTNPDVAVSTWRVMGISKFEMWQTGPLEYEAQAVDGSEGLADVLFRDENNCVFICDGRYHNPLLPKPLEAAALVWFRYGFAPAKDGTWVVTQSADVFVSFPSQGLAAVAKVLTPVTNSMMDRNLFEVSLYASLMSRAVRDEPEWVIQVASQMEGVIPQRTPELIAIARQPRLGRTISSRHISRQAEAAEKAMLLPSTISLFEITKPEDLAAVPGAPALPVPPVSANAGATTAASSSASSIRPSMSSGRNSPAARSAFSARPTVTIGADRTEMAQNPAAVRPKPAVAKEPAASAGLSDSTEFALQPAITPPLADGGAAKVSPASSTSVPMGP